MAVDGAKGWTHAGLLLYVLVVVLVVCALVGVLLVLIVPDSGVRSPAGATLAVDQEGGEEGERGEVRDERGDDGSETGGQVLQVCDGVGLILALLQSFPVAVSVDGVGIGPKMALTPPTQ